MKITILTVGKIKEKYLKDAIAEYAKRLSRYCKLEIVEVADEKTIENASQVLETQIRDKEAERLMKYIREDAYVITLEIKGKIRHIFFEHNCDYGSANLGRWFMEWKDETHGAA